VDGPWQPLLVIEAKRARFAHPVLVVLGFMVVAIGTALAAYCGAIPWLRRGAPVYLWVLHPAFWKLVLLPLGVVLALLATRFIHARAGRVEFYEDRIELSKHEGAVVVHWRDLVGYRDDSADYIQLLRRGESAPSWKLTVPTTTEEARTAVLHLLDARGLKRKES
jgi:hypothetical protein